MRTDNLASFLSILFDKHHVTPRGCTEMTGVIVRIPRPNEAVIRHMVPFFARDFAGFATDAHTRISKKANFDLVAHVRMPALIRAVRAFANHKVAQASGLRGRLGTSETHALLFSALILFLHARDHRRCVPYRSVVLLGAKLPDRLAMHIG